MKPRTRSAAKMTRHVISRPSSSPGGISHRSVHTSAVFEKAAKSGEETSTYSCMDKHCYNRRQQCATTQRALRFMFRWDNSTDASIFKLLVNKRSES